VRTLYNNKINEPTTSTAENRWPQVTAHHFTEWCRCKASYVPHTSRHVAAVLLEPSAPIQRAAPLALVCFVVVVLVRNLYFPPAQVICWNCARRKLGPLWLIGRHGMSAGPIGDSLKHCATASQRFQPHQAAASSLASHSRRSH
jgi:hypothetical protein